MKNCVFCNNPIEDNATYCTYCGKRQPANNMQQQPLRKMHSQPQRNKKSNNLLYFIIGLLSTIVLLLGGYMIYNLTSDKKVAENDETKSKRDTVVIETTQKEEAPVAPVAPPKVYTIEGSHHMSGSISRYGITMDINVSGSYVSGTYYYHSVGSKHRMTVTGDVSGNYMTLEEYSPDGINTGSFSGTFNGRVYKGSFTNYEKGSNLSFTITDK